MAEIGIGSVLALGVGGKNRIVEITLNESCSFGDRSKVSLGSPLGKALCEKPRQKGDKVKYTSPRGDIEVEIIEIMEIE